jgi:CheY-like chemotaxis protein
VQLKRYLEQQGHAVALAENGRQALEMLGTSSFDLVLLDILIPELDGFEVLGWLKADPALRDLPVIVISALEEMDSVIRCIGLGAEDFLPKPFDPLLLRARLGTCLEKKRLRDQEVEKRDPWVRPGGTTFYFVNGGPERAIQQAQESAGSRDVRIAGGADVIQQYLNLGVIDELEIALAPVLFGGGRRLFENLRVPAQRFRVDRVLDTQAATHLRYVRV